MRSDDLKQSRTIFFCFLGVFLFFTMGCQHNTNSEENKTKAPEKNEASDSEVIKIVTSSKTLAEDTKKVFPGEVPPQLVPRLKDSVVEILPYAFGKNKERLNEIVKYFEGVEKNPEVYFDDSNNVVELMKTIAQLGSIFAEIEPDNFHVNYQVAYNYLYVASSIDSFIEEPSEEQIRLGEEYNQKALRTAEALVKKFPNEAKAYRQDAFITYLVEKNKEKSFELYKRCLELDSEMEACRKGYDTLQKRLKD